VGLSLILGFALLAAGTGGASAQLFGGGGNSNDSGGFFGRRPAPPPPRYVPPPGNSAPAQRGTFRNSRPANAPPPGYYRPPSGRGFGVPGPVQQAAPAQPPQRRGFFSFLFGGGNTDRPSGWPYGGNAPVEVAKPPQQAAPRVVRPARPPVEVTTFVQVLGDGIADQLGVGLNEAFDDRPEISVKRRVRIVSGLTKPEDYDWAKAAGEVAAAEKLNYVVIQLGSRDSQPMHQGDVDIPPLSEEWKRLYAERIDAVLAPFKAKGIKTYWVGLPPVKSEVLSADFAAINEIVKERTALAGATYVDVWEGFLDEDNAYTQTGPDMEGREVKLRLADGIAFTRAGSRKLAHYVEREIRRDLEGKIAPSEIALPGIAPGDVGKARPDAGPLIVLTAAPKAPKGELAGATPMHVGAVSEIERVLVKGEALEPMPGRLDDASWRPNGDAAAAVTAAAAPVTPASTPVQPAPTAAASPAPEVNAAATSRP
jgi:hypothetical protein